MSLKPSIHFWQIQVRFLFSAYINNIDGDWNKRFNAIKRLEGIILGGGFEMDGFPAMMSKLYLHFSAQVKTNFP